MSQQKGKRVFVGLSGGVDSSVSAALLQEAGFDVTGVFIKGWYPDWLECDWKNDRRDAMRVCAALDIPFQTLDLEKEYKEGVVDYMIREYEKGRTPNPDVMCNREVKFGGFLRYALESGADFIATGHYARVKEENGAGRLFEGADKGKDQSYFLWTLTQEQLKHVLFPVGDMEKVEVRNLAEKFDLPNARKKDSQGVCFLGEVDMEEFLRKYVDAKPGDVLDAEGDVIGTHDGAIFLTYGQRHGFTITKKTPNDSRMFVVGKDVERNTVTVSSSIGQGDLHAVKEITLSGESWVGGAPSQGKKYGVRLRYRQEKAPCAVEEKDGAWTVILDEPQGGISPGQSAVVYDSEECIGGGIIEVGK